MRRATGITAPTLGAIAVLALAGGARWLPAEAAFFLAALAVLLFPGSATATLAPRLFAGRSALETLGLWFPVGVSVACIFGFIGLALRTSLSHLMLALAAAYACLLITLVARMLRGRRRKLDLPAPCEATGSFTPESARPTGARLVAVVLVLVAVACALVTLTTPRNEDDWYYLAYIRDFVSDHNLRSADAIVGPSEPASPRTWYASWWVVEAIVSRASGVDPVTAHQVYFPLLIVPFAVLAGFALARQIFPDSHTALVACCFQFLFYISSAYPHNSTGWLVFCRSSQDKAVACFVMVPAAAALALRLLSGIAGAPHPAASHDSRPQGACRGSAWQVPACYALLALGAVLVHPLSVAWIGLAVVPYALLETVRLRHRRALATLAIIVLPVLALSGILASGASDLSSDLDVKAARQTAAAKQTGETETQTDEAARPWREGPSKHWSAATWPAYLYLPGEGFPWASAEGDFSTVVRLGGNPLASNPSYIIRYPLAIAGLIATLLLLAGARRDSAARYLVVTTLAVLLAAFVPVAAALAAKALTWKLVYRLGWVLPWGFTLGLWASKVRIGRRAWRGSGLLVLVIAALALGRGNPANYIKSFRAWPQTSRPQPQTVEALRFLGSQPAPQGVVLASAGVSQQISAFIADAYPAAYRGSRTLSRSEIDALLRYPALTPEAVAGIRRSQARYIIAENTLPISRALGQSPAGFAHIYANTFYDIWEVLDARPAGPPSGGPPD